MVANMQQRAPILGVRKEGRRSSRRGIKGSLRRLMSRTNPKGGRALMSCRPKSPEERAQVWVGSLSFASVASSLYQTVEDAVSNLWVSQRMSVALTIFA